MGKAHGLDAATPGNSPEGALSHQVGRSVEEKGDEETVEANETRRLEKDSLHTHRYPKITIFVKPRGLNFTVFTIVTRTKRISTYLKTLSNEVSQKLSLKI